MSRSHSFPCLNSLPQGRADIGQGDQDNDQENEIAVQNDTPTVLGMIPQAEEQDSRIGMNLDTWDDGVGPPNTTLTDGTESNEYSLETLRDDHLDLLPKRYIYLSTLHKIGGVSTGPVKLFMKDVIDHEQNPPRPSGQREITAARKYSRTCGGQCYMPQLLSLSGTNQMSPEKITTYKSLPMLLTCIFLDGHDVNVGNRREMYKTFIDGVTLLDDVAKTFHDGNKHRWGLGVRFEWYQQDTLTSINEKTIELPRFKYLETIKHCDREDLMNPLAVLFISLKDMLVDVAKQVAASIKVAKDEDGEVPVASKVQSYPADVKTAYLYCAERAIALAFDNVPLGKVTRNLNSGRMPNATQHWDDELFPRIPKSARSLFKLKRNLAGLYVDKNGNPVDEADAAAEDYGTGLPYGIKSRNAQLPNHQVGFTIDYASLRRNVGFIQQIGSASYKSIHLPKLYYVSVGLVTEEFLKVGSPGTPLSEVGIFDFPDFRAIANNIDDDGRKIFMKELAKILCTVYHTEWWFLLRERVLRDYRQNPQFDRGIVDRINHMETFPRTSKEFDEWHEQVLGRDYNTTVQPTREMRVGTIQLDTTTKVLKYVS